MNYNSIVGERIFITGGTGFIGSTLIGRLIDHNQITVYDNLSRNSLENKDYRNHPNLKVIQGNVLDLELLKQSIQGSTYVIHAAGIAGIDTVIKNPVLTMNVNMVGSANLLEACTTLEHCKRIICFSTSEVFGQMAFRSEETSSTVLGAVGEARWTYAVSKLAVEHLSYAYFKEYKLPTVTVRPFNIFGPGQVGEGAVRIFVQKALANEIINIHGDGTQIRAWCYVDDMVEGILCCMTREEAIGESFNIGNKHNVITIYGLANTILRVLKSHSEIHFVEQTSVDIELRVPQVEKAKRMLGFEAKVDLEEGIRRTGDYFRGRQHD
ncbi:NAD-dependent epimerase/dehydratase family protein [Paenibacillus sp. H1-7]|uniref:NAD-dependent epimerase/dehydratase family protein n=1 Tax=Paenibacillus sp. H1-7 TaxID=2282849 RepID=UPI001EF910CC|nr:NAD-dependent epimerase/dehydratase family protein [Paenibacillus sp. H1-7]ULL19449.1 NAD-dependent epimerase/dehydratase family protein [Paenibacillus sp. H1-7]